MIKNNAGYDLKQLCIGSKGTRGIITRAVLRLHPKPGCVHAALCGLGSSTDVVVLLGAALSGLGPMLSAFEVMWPDYWHEPTQTVGVRSPLSGQHAFYVLIKVQGLSEESDGPRFQTWIEGQFEAGSVEDAAILQSLANIAAFRATRDACSEFGSLLGPHVAFDIGLPVARMDDFVCACRDALDKGIPDALSVYYGHIGDSNLHLIALSRTANAQPMAEIAGIVYATVRDFGGSVSAEHGIGLLKKPYLGYSRTPEELALMRRIKAALDPQSILNPGKIFDMEQPE
ncbi:MAG: FAD-binding oxidoreductase [Paracoccaceae bacterium]